MFSPIPTISVVIPTYRRPFLVVRAVQSALAQTYREIEVIVVIDGPDSSTVEALSAIGDVRVRYVELAEKVGGSEARNVGAREAKGSWIALLDDDDEWLPTKLEKQMGTAHSSTYSDSVLVLSSYICRANGVPDVVRPRRLPKRGEPLSEFMFDYLCYFQTSTFLCTKSLFLQVPFDPDAAFFQDIDWLLRLSRVPEFQLAVVSEPLSIYTVPSTLPGITSSLDWRSRLQWGRERRSLMSQRAYSRFIVGSCVGRAVQEGAGMEGFKRLLFEVCVNGSPTPYLVTLLCLGFLVSPAQRKRLRDKLFLAKPENIPLSIPEK
jgi:glycosyltransferase involved in cell wall biosynthesis